MALMSQIFVVSVSVQLYKCICLNSICCDVFILFDVWTSDLLKVGGNICCNSFSSLIMLFIFIKPYNMDFLSIYNSVFSVVPFISLSVLLSFRLSVFLSFCLFVFRTFCLSVFGHLSSYKFIFVQFHLSIFLSFTGLWS